MHGIFLMIIHRETAWYLKDQDPHKASLPEEADVVISRSQQVFFFKQSSQAVRVK